MGKLFKLNKYMVLAITLLVAIAFFIIGKGNTEYASGLSAATVVALTAEEKADFTEPEQKMLMAVKKMVVGVQDAIKTGKISDEEASLFKSGVIESLRNGELKALKDELAAMDLKAKTQGINLAEMELKLSTNTQGTFKNIGEVLQDNEPELKRVYLNGSGAKTFIVNTGKNGELVMKPFDMTKTAGPHATIDGISSGTAAITQAIDAATLLRLGGASQIISNYRNTPWVFDLVNTINAGFDMPFAMWYEEGTKQGASTTVAEGVSKPLMQYVYALKTASYKKEAALIGFTDEFSLDFARLQSDIMNKGRIDVVNRINTALLANITSSATAYNTATSFLGGVTVDAVNDYDALAAMAAQVDNATFGAMANSALMSTFKKYRMGIVKDGDKSYLNRPAVLDNLAFIGNPGMGADNVIVGDLKAYNVILRGGFIIKIGYNGTDFAEKRFSCVMEQYYFDYISEIRKVAIVKGADFASVKTAIS